jgi:hypothetical protein
MCLFLLQNHRFEGISGRKHLLPFPYVELLKLLISVEIFKQRKTSPFKRKPGKS